MAGAGGREASNGGGLCGGRPWQAHLPLVPFHGKLWAILGACV